jgi:aspartate 1-decarboxylase
MRWNSAMQRTLLKSKIHRATVTACDLNYVGSLTLDAQLMAAAGIREYEQVHVVNINNGARFETYAIRGESGSGQVQVNGAAARLAECGDIVIVFSYAQYEESELAGLTPTVVWVDEFNHQRPSATGFSARELFSATELVSQVSGF